MQDFKVGARDKEVRNQCKVSSFAIKIVVVFACCYPCFGSFIEPHAYFKALTHFLKLHLEKILFSQKLNHCFFPRV